MAKKGANINIRQRNKKKTGLYNDTFSTDSQQQPSSKLEDDQLLNDAIHSAKAKNQNKTYLYLLLLTVAGSLIVFVVASIMSSPFVGDSSAETPPPLSSPTTTTTTTTTTTREPISKIVTDYKIIQTLPHDPRAFTQGLTFRTDNSTILYESTGNYKESELRVLDLTRNGEILQQYELPDEYFGEGLSYVPPSKGAENGPGRLIHITYKEQTGFIFDVDTMEVLEEFKYDNELTTSEGWGIIHVPPSFDEHDTEYIVSDGSEYLHFWNAQFQTSKPKLRVTYRTEDMAARDMPPQPIKFLNELEWDKSSNTILANVWYQDMLVRICPRTGFLTTIYNLRSLYTDRIPEADSFNGIALNAEGDVWVTGKNWPHLYQIELGEAS